MKMTQQIQDRKYWGNVSIKLLFVLKLKFIPKGLISKVR